MNEQCHGLPLVNTDACAVVDADAFPVLSQHHWYLFEQQKSGVRCARRVERRNGRQVSIYLHREALSNPDGYVYPIDGDWLNCQRANLEVVPTHLARAKSRIRSDNASGYKGVYWESRKGKWAAAVYFQKKRHYIGRFDDPKDAAMAYDAKALELRGDRAFLNFPNGDNQ